MSFPWQAEVRDLLMWISRRIGSKITDARSGEVLGRGLLFPWRGKIYVFGLYEGKSVVFPVFLPEMKVRSWKQVIGFSVHPPPDFPHEPRS